VASYTESALARRRDQRVDVVSDQQYQWSRSLRGVPSPGNRNYRASVSSWERGLSMSRTVGTGVGVFGESVFIADDGTLSNAGTTTVKVIDDDGTRYVPISYFRRERVPRRKTATAAETQAARDYALMLAAGQTQDYEGSGD